MKIKVMHLIEHLQMGGAETLITNYALKINKKKFEVIIVTLCGRCNTINENRLKENGIKVIFLGDRLIFPKDTKNLFRRIINKIHRYILFVKCVNKEKPNIIHSHLNVTEYLMFLNVKKINIKLYYTVHSEVMALFGKNKFIPRFFTNYCIKKKGMIPIALHENMRNDVNVFFDTDNTIVLRNGIDIERFNRNFYDKTEILKSLNLNENSFIIGHIGRFSKSKNHRFIIKVFKEVKNKRPDAHLILIGTGELKNAIKEEVKNLGIYDSISFLGNRSDIPELLSIMDVFIFPSLYEGIGIALLEAQAMGIKCVVSDRIPKDALINDNIIVLSLDSPIEEWCKYILNDNSITKNTRNIKNMEKYDLNVIVKELEQIYLSN